MSTRSRISVLIDDGKIKSVYCHFDGYDSGVGNDLLKHYNTQELAEKVVELGDLSCLYESMNCPINHSFENRVEGYSVAYHRDRGENWDNTKPVIVDSIEKVKPFYEEFNYYWNGTSWLVDAGEGFRHIEI